MKLTLPGLYASPPPTRPIRLRYQKLSDPLNYDQSYPAIVVKSLHSKYALLVTKVKFIVAESGSPLSHLAIVSREHGVTVFITDLDLADLPDKGLLSADTEHVELGDGQ